MTDIKMTKKDWYKVIAEMVKTSNHPQKEGMLQFIDHEVELLGNRKSAQSKTQKENVEVMVAIKDALASVGKPVTVTELQTVESMAGYSNQKLSALLRQMIQAGTVVKTIDHKKAYFSLAE